jgi:hypothetical protein
MELVIKATPSGGGAAGSRGPVSLQPDSLPRSLVAGKKAILLKHHQGATKQAGQHSGLKADSLPFVPRSVKPHEPVLSTAPPSSAAAAAAAAAVADAKAAVALIMQGLPSAEKSSFNKENV